MKTLEETIKTLDETTTTATAATATATTTAATATATATATTPTTATTTPTTEYKKQYRDDQDNNNDGDDDDDDGNNGIIVDVNNNNGKENPIVFITAQHYSVMAMADPPHHYQDDDDNDNDNDDNNHDPLFEASKDNPAFVVLKGQVQPAKFRDWPFAVVFVGQVVAILGTAMALGPSALSSSSSHDHKQQQQQQQQHGISLVQFFVFLLLCLLLASMNAMGVVLCFLRTRYCSDPHAHTHKIVRASFFVAPITFTTMALILLLARRSKGTNQSDDNHHEDAVTFDIIDGIFWTCAILLSLISIGYHRCYRNVLPTAVATFQMAMTAIPQPQTEFLLYRVCLVTLLILYVWCLLWSLAFAGMIYRSQQKPLLPCQPGQVDPNSPVYYDQGPLCHQHPSGVAVAVLLFCLYWTQQVIQTTMHTLTARIVASGYVSVSSSEQDDENEGNFDGLFKDNQQKDEDNNDHHPNDVDDDEVIGRDGGGSSVFGSVRLGPDISTGALVRACFFSFGSICFGSLLMAPCRILQRLTRGYEGCRRCHHRGVPFNARCCSCGCLGSSSSGRWIHYFNSWAFCYVGMYGYDYRTAGKKVVDLFRARGWTTTTLASLERFVFRIILWLTNMGVAALTGTMCALLVFWLGHFERQTSQMAGAAMLGFWIGFAMALLVGGTVLSVVESTVRTTLVCLAEQPNKQGPFLLSNWHELRNMYASVYPEAFDPGSSSIPHSPHSQEMKPWHGRNVV